MYDFIEYLELVTNKTMMILFLSYMFRFEELIEL